MKLPIYINYHNNELSLKDQNQWIIASVF